MLPEANRHGAVEPGQLTVRDPAFRADDENELAGLRRREIAEPPRRLLVEDQPAGGAGKSCGDALRIRGLADRRHPRAPALLRRLARDPAPLRHRPISARAAPDR